MKVAIAGSGIMGLFSAYYLVEEGCEVVVIEKEPGPAGASMGNAGMIVPSHFIPLASPGVISQGIRWIFNKKSPFYIQPRINIELISWIWKFYRASRSGKMNDRMKVLRDLGLTSRLLYDEILKKEKIDPNFKTGGLLMHCKTQKALEDEVAVAEKANSLGIDARVLSGTEAQNLDPGSKLSVEGSVYYPGDAFLTPDMLLNSLVEILKVKGVKFMFNTAIDNISLSGKSIKCVASGDMEVEADEFVLAAGSWSSQLAKLIDLKIPMQPGKGYSFTLKDPVSAPEICSILVEERIAVTPMKHGLRFGGTMEISGFNSDINPSKIQGISEGIPKYFPEFSVDHFKGLDVWYGYRPCSPDGLPYIGKTGRYENLTIATGHAMMGLSLGPVTGKMVMESIISGAPVQPLLSPDRY